MFLNYYRCDRCNHEWTDMWERQVDDDCGACGARHTSPYDSEDLDGEAEEDGELDVVRWEAAMKPGSPPYFKPAIGS